MAVPLVDSAWAKCLACPRLIFQPTMQLEPATLMPFRELNEVTLPFYFSSAFSCIPFRRASLSPASSCINYPSLFPAIMCSSWYQLSNNILAMNFTM